MAKFKLLRGGHQQTEVNEETGEKSIVNYHATDKNVITTDKDLVALFGTQKFEKLDDNVVGSRSAVRTLETMTVAELKQLAEDEEIDLGDASKKVDILEMIKLALEAV